MKKKESVSQQRSRRCKLNVAGRLSFAPCNIGQITLRTVIASCCLLTAVFADSASVAPTAGERKPGAEPRPRVFLLDAAQLQTVKQRIQAGDKQYAPALAQLKLDAKKALKAGLFSVINKDATPPSGDKHDYMSLAPYHWPNPDTTNGLPYVRHDGKRNPEIYKTRNRLDLGEMVDAVETFSLAYYFTGDETYAGKATQVIRAWYLDPATRMNPNLQYAQAIRGVNTGRGTGLIETRAFARIVDSVGLLAGSKAWTKADQRKLEEWFGQFLHWMLESENGRDEAARKNNHGTYYDVQVASYAFFLGNDDRAKQVLQNVGPKRIAIQVEPDGKQPLELARTKAWSYSVGNLAGLMSLAKLGEHVGVDLWHYETPDGRSIRKALDFLLPFGLGEQKWPYQQINGFSADLFYPVLRLAALKYPDGPYPALLSKMPPADPAQQNNLFLSPLEPVNRLHLPEKESE